MGPGLPGLGIASLFYVGVALFAPFREVVLTMRGQSSLERWHVAIVQFILGIVILGAVVVQYVAIDRIIAGGLLTAARGPKALAGIPNFAYAIAACVAVLLIGTAWARIARAVNAPERADVIAASHRFGFDVSEHPALWHTTGSVIGEQFRPALHRRRCHRGSRRCSIHGRRGRLRLPPKAGQLDLQLRDA